MADDAPTKTAPAPAPAAPEAPASFDLTVTEWCTRKSGSDNRVELIGAFHAFVIANGGMKDSDAGFEAQYAAFADLPA